MAGCFGGLDMLGGGNNITGGNTNGGISNLASFFVNNPPGADTNANTGTNANMGIPGLTTKENYQGIAKLLGGSGGLKSGERIQGLLNILKLLGIGKGI